MTSRFLERLAEGPLLCDGGCFRELERTAVLSRLTDMPRAVLEYPEAVLAMHRQFALAGAEVLQAVCWSTRDATSTAGPTVRDERYRVAVRLAHQAAGPDRYVAGTLTRYVEADDWGTLTEAQRRQTEREFEWRIGEQVDAGAGLFILETFETVEEVCLAIPYVKRAGRPCVVTLAFGETPFTRDAYLPGEAAKRLVDAGADVVGANCRRPPRTLLPLVEEMRRAVSVPLCTQPAAYEPSPGEVSVPWLAAPNASAAPGAHVVSPGAMAAYALEAVASGVRLIGACCGAQPHHVRAMAQALGKRTNVPVPEIARAPVLA
ncbi:MAG: homocysteine S-methyltransferase family protein [Chloroflexi bacterium]|nr:homocysteine S-methyltransferase family protein [Chloroflexota bacterium]